MPRNTGRDQILVRLSSGETIVDFRKAVNDVRLPLVMPSSPPAHGAVHLRAFRADDVSMLQDLATDPYVPMTGTLPARADRAQALAYIDRQHERLATGAGYSFCVALRDSDEGVGQAGLSLTAIEAGRASAGYAVAPQFRGSGVAAQALTALTDFAWTLLELQRIELYIEPWNIASRRTAETAGYEPEGLVKQHQVIGGRRVDMLLHSAVRSPRQLSAEV